MSARVSLCLLACLMAAPVSAYEISYLKIIELREEVDDRGEVDIFGTILNTHPYLSAESVKVVLTFKKDGVVVTAIDGIWCSDYSTDKTCEFSKGLPSIYKKEDYDSVSARIESAYFSMPETDPWLLTGELSLVEESLSVRAHVSSFGGDEGWIEILGELHNGTNAMLEIKSVSFGLWDANDNFLGRAEDNAVHTALFFASANNVMPGEIVSFKVGNPDILFERVARYRIDIKYILLRYIDDVATGVEAASWGQIKARGRR